MKTLIKLTLLALMVFPTSVMAQSDNDLVIPLSNPGQPGKLKVSIIQGDIEIIGYDGQDVRISYDGDDNDRRDRNRSNRRGLRRISGSSVGLEATERNNEVNVSVSPTSDDADLVIRVPKNFSLNLSVINDGDIEVENVNGEHEISNLNGDVEMTDMGGSMLVNTINGDIEVEFKSIAANTPMSFTTVNGDIELALPPSAQFDFKIKTEWGDILSDFDFVVRRTEDTSKSSRRNGQYKITVNKWVSGSINGGGAEYLFKSLHGDIVIRKN